VHRPPRPQVMAYTCDVCHQPWTMHPGLDGWCPVPADESERAPASPAKATVASPEPSPKANSGEVPEGGE
jgi:hypothetical protein